MKKVILFTLRLFWGIGLLVIGFAIGISVKVFIVRGVPVIHGGGELLVLVAIPVCIGFGFKWGLEYAERKNKWRE